MSVQTGIYSFDGRDIDRREIEFLLLGVEERGPDYAGSQLCGAIGMGFRGLMIAPEDQQDQPLRSSSGTIITFDGRLDRRADLARHLGLPGSTKFSDITLVLRAYEQFGAGCFQELMGEFAFALWDGRQRSLFFARSLCGTRPLFYVRTGSQLLWSSELDDLVVKSGIEAAVNDNYAVQYLFFHADIDQSPFNNVSVVPSGSYIETTFDGQTKPAVSTWHPERIQTLHLKSQGEYEETWLEQVETALEDRLRATGPVFSELSGGLDSSTIVLLADRILKRTGRDSKMLTTISYTYETSEDSDESAFIKLVERARGREGMHIPEKSLGITSGLSDITFTGLPNTAPIFPGMYGSVAQLMKSSGCRVLFNGVGGDELFGADPTGNAELADLLISGHLISVLSNARRWSQLSGIPLWQTLFRFAIIPLTHRDHRFSAGPESATLGSLLTSEAKRSLVEPGYRLGLRIDSAIGLPSRRSRAFSVRSFRCVFSTGTFRHVPGLYISHPFAHQQLINFVLSLPMDQINRPGMNRYLMRRALRGILPERIRTRMSKAGPDEAFCRALARERQVINEPANFLVCKRGYASATALAEAIRQAILGRMESSGLLLQIFSLERWLQSLSMIQTRRQLLKRLTRQPTPRVEANVSAWSRTSM